MPTIPFVVPGPPVGYYAQAGRNLWKMSPSQREQAEKYRNYKDKVKLYAVQAGLVLPLNATEAAPVIVNIRAYFFNRVHCDPGNVQKGCCDALFQGSNDRYTGGSFPPPIYDPKNPRVEVEVILPDGYIATPGVKIKHGKGTARTGTDRIRQSSQALHLRPDRGH